MSRLLLALVACLAPAVSGCVAPPTLADLAARPYGAIYSHKVEPLTLNFDQTPVVTDTAAGDVKDIQYYVRVVWNNNGIGAIAKENGFSKVYYADLETLSVLGIWTQHWVHVYGSK